VSDQPKPPGLKSIFVDEHDAACPDHDHPPGHCRRPDLVKPPEASLPLITDHEFVPHPMHFKDACGYYLGGSVDEVESYCGITRAAHRAEPPELPHHFGSIYPGGSKSGGYDGDAD